MAMRGARTSNDTHARCVTIAIVQRRIAVAAHAVVHTGDEDGWNGHRSRKRLIKLRPDVVVHIVHILRPNRRCDSEHACDATGHACVDALGGVLR